MKPSIKDLKEIAERATALVGKDEDVWFRYGRSAVKPGKSVCEYFATFNPSLVLELLGELEKLRDFIEYLDPGLNVGSVEFQKARKAILRESEGER